ncbi:MAG: hypothetical protein EYC70_05550 [Planctomycetota bacterium]|nr:MAG: hypothetical protein EYC70_05550 [Planctomycetota bacterium]
MRLTVLASVTVLACVLLPVPALAAQVPDGWYVTSNFKDVPTGYTGDGGLFYFHPRTPTSVTVVTGLGPDLTGAGSSGGVGASAVLLRPSDGALLVGETTNLAPDDLDLHLIHLSGAAVMQDVKYNLGTNTTGWCQVGQAALLPNGDVLVAVEEVEAGPLANETLGLVNLTTGVVTPVPVTGLPSAIVTTNALAVHPSGTVAYVGFHWTGVYARIHTVPLPAGGVGVWEGTLPSGVLNLAYDNANSRLIAGCNSTTDLYAFPVNPSNPFDLGSSTTIPNNTGSGVNALAMETVTGNLAAGAGSGCWLIKPGGTASPLTGGPPSGWGVLAGIAVNPNPKTYGIDTPGVNTYAWQLEPNAGGLPTLGNQAFSLTISGSPGGAPGEYAVSERPANMPYQGITLLIDPGQILRREPIPRSGVIPLALPVKSAYLGRKFYVQTVHQEPGGLASSDGVQFTIM